MKTKLNLLLLLLSLGSGCSLVFSTDDLREGAMDGGSATDSGTTDGGVGEDGGEPVDDDAGEPNDAGPMECNPTPTGNVIQLTPEGARLSVSFEEGCTGTTTLQVGDREENVTIAAGDDSVSIPFRRITLLEDPPAVRLGGTLVADPLYPTVEFVSVELSDGTTTDTLRAPALSDVDIADDGTVVFTHDPDPMTNDDMVALWAPNQSQGENVLESVGDYGSVNISADARAIAYTHRPGEVGNHGRVRFAPDGRSPMFFDFPEVFDHLVLRTAPSTGMVGRRAIYSVAFNTASRGTGPHQFRQDDIYEDRGAFGVDQFAGQGGGWSPRWWAAVRITETAGVGTSIVATSSVCTGENRQLDCRSEGNSLTVGRDCGAVFYGHCSDFSNHWYVTASSAEEPRVLNGGYWDTATRLVAGSEDGSRLVIGVPNDDNYSLVLVTGDLDAPENTILSIDREGAPVPMSPISMHENVAISLNGEWAVYNIPASDNQVHLARVRISD